MVHKTIKGAIKEALQDLSKKLFLEFRHQLRDRREQPRVCLSDVEDKSVLEITDLLVSTFTEPKASEVTVDLLRQINCNNEADTLYSKTKACMDKGDPTFRKTLTGGLETKPSQEAKNYAASRLPLQAAVRRDPMKKPEEVEADAKARVVSEGGDPDNERLVLSRCMIQFGQYKGQTNKWLLENDLDYTAFILAQHEKQRQTTRDQSPLMANKDCLTRYAMAYREVEQEVRFQRAYNRSCESGPKGNALVGFGRFKSERLKDLYKSEDKDKIGYVDYLRGKRSTCDPGSKMDIAIKYILKRDQNVRTRRNRTQSTRY
ncbi:apoptosis-associated speck-like protein containing a CARD [Centropristis striata]|uniref:apoptosis-associated speck-like protein containing a CARD n=1 Tax=Centropristis striata TaxID=184440 RepID=UPI0027DF41F2|nr:apoptosis-associated speck-like protein containing a CARD [Centropristis striata]